MKMLEVFFKPTHYFSKSFASVSLGSLAVVYTLVFVLFAVIAVVAALLSQGNAASALLTFVTTRILPFLFLLFLMTVLPKLIIGSKNKKFSFADSAKVFLSAQLITTAFQIVSELISVVLLVVSADFVKQASTVTSLSMADQAELSALSGQAFAFGGIGILLCCFVLAGLIWTAVTAYKGFKIVGKTDSATAAIATIAPYLISLCVGFALSFVVTALGFAVLGTV